MATYQSFKLQTSHSLNGLQWPVDKPKGNLLIVHGQGEHAARYEHVAQFFGAKGWQTWSADLPGHGHSPGKRGHVMDMDEYTEVAQGLIEKAKSTHPDVPIILYGHSLGGVIVLDYILRHSNLPIHGAIVTSPFIRLHEDPPSWLLAIGRVVVRFAPSMQQDNRLNLEYLTTDPAVIETYKADPLVHSKVSFAAAFSMLERTGWVDQYQGEVPIPLLIMHGMKDQLTSPAASEEFAQRVGGPLTWKPWPELYHEIQNGLKKEQVLATMEEWIQSIL